MFSLIKFEIFILIKSELLQKYVKVIFTILYYGNMYVINTVEEAKVIIKNQHKVCKSSSSYCVRLSVTKYS